MKRYGVRKSSADSRLRMILETMDFAVGFQRVVFYLRDATNNAQASRFGLSDGTTGVAAAMRVRVVAFEQAG